MTLDDELRAALGREAEMRTTPQPDVEGLVRGGQTRRRRHNVARIGVAAAAAVLVGGAAYGVTQIDRGNSGTAPGIADQPSESTEPSESTTIPPYRDTNGGPLRPGTYRKLVGTNEAGTGIEADLTFDGVGWISGGQPTVTDGENWAGIGVYQPLALASGSGCLSDPLNWAGGKTPRNLAGQLARLPRSTVVQPATPTDAFGHDAIHLRLRIDNQCPEDDGYRVAEAAAGSRGVNYGEVPNVVVIDFWVVDVDGTLIVVDLFRYDATPPALVDQATQARDSITFVTRE